MLSYVKDIVPFVKQVREDIELGEDQAALAIFDHFNCQLTPKVTECLRNIISNQCWSQLAVLIGYNP